MLIRKLEVSIVVWVKESVRAAAPQLCCLGSGRGRDGSLQRDLVIELFWHSVILPLGKSAGGSRIGGGVLGSIGTLC